MSELRQALIEKKSEAQQMLEIISDISISDGAIVKTAILKSAYVLLLYNMIESTSFLIFEKIHEKVACENYTQLCTAVQKIWVDFLFANHSSDTHYDHLEGILQQRIKFPLVDVFTNRIKLFSGNLDAKKINELMKRYAIGVLRTADRDKLAMIKKRRNSVAHGEEMFKEACRDLSESDLLELRNATFSALDDIVSQVELYLNEKKYLSSAIL